MAGEIKQEEAILGRNVSFGAYVSLWRKKILFVKLLNLPLPGVRKILKSGINVPIFSLNFTILGAKPLRIHRFYL